MIYLLLIVLLPLENCCGANQDFSFYDKYRGLLPNNSYIDPNIIVLPTSTPTPNVQPSLPEGDYCFHFTWFPKKKYEEVAGKVCSDINPYDKRKPLCVNPMAVTENGDPPDFDSLWTSTLGLKTYCNRSKEEICAKYTYYYAGEPQNVTYYCTKITVKDEREMTSGCLVQEELTPGYSAEVCACSWRRPTRSTPCNSAFSPGSGVILQTVVIFLLTLLGST